jgi:putative ABC transport system permease protein
MFYHLKIILRNLRRGGIYSAVNTVGLAVGITACVLIMLWVQDELSFDKFHTRSKDIYQTNVRFKGTDNDTYWNIACAPLSFTAKEEIPEIENVCRY